MSLTQRLKRRVPVRLRLLRSDLLHALRRDRAYHEREGRRQFFRNAFQALAFNGIHGDYAEFGCCGAMTFRLAYAAARRGGHGARFWAFDSFQGLPPQAGAQDSHPMWVEGDMSMSLADFRAVCESGGVPAGAYTAVPGFYGETLADTARSRPDRPARIALAYVDCDLHSSTADVLAFLAPRLQNGMILAFDDYFCASPEAASGERLAMLEFLDAHPEFAFVPYLPIGWHGMSFIVESRGLLAGAGSAAERAR